VTTLLLVMGALRIWVTWPLKRSPGKASTVKRMFWPVFTRPTSASSTATFTSIWRRSRAMVNSTGAWNEAATVWPTSTLRLITHAVHRRADDGAVQVQAGLLQARLALGHQGSGAAHLGPGHAHVGLGQVPLFPRGVHGGLGGVQFGGGDEFLLHQGALALQVAVGVLQGDLRLGHFRLAHGEIAPGHLRRALGRREVGFRLGDAGFEGLRVPGGR
jgi:hypothetical protein